MSDRKIRSDCTQMSACGRTSRSRCIKLRELPECKGCRLVRRLYSNWVMVDRKPMKICSRCGRALPPERFYARTIVRGDRVYRSSEGICKQCRSERRYEKLAMARASPPCRK